MKKAFTLIETIVVIAVIGITLPVIFTIILALMREQVKIYRMSQVKREGDYAINLMENTIRNKAVTIYKLAVLDDFNSASPADLTSSKIIVPSFSISCSSGSSYSPASISLKFDICYDTGSGDCTLSTRPEERTLIHYQAGFKLRSH